MLILLESLLVKPNVPEALLSDAIALLKRSLLDVDDAGFSDCIISSIADIQSIFSINFEASATEDSSSSLLRELNEDSNESPFMERRDDKGDLFSLDEVVVLAHLRCLQLIKATLLNIKVSPCMTSANPQTPTLALFSLLNAIVIPSINSTLSILQTGGLEVLSVFCTMERVVGHFLTS